MKRIIINIAAALALCAVAVGCDAFRKASSAGASATGNPYEVIVVCAQPEWQSELGDTLQAVLRQPVSELTTYEPMFDVLRILPDNFGSLVERHRNIITVQVDASIAEPSITVRYDVTAKPQVFISIKGPDDKSVADYVSENRDNLVRVLEKAERDRSIDYGKRFASEQTEVLLREKFGVQMYVPDNFQVRTQSDDMVWISQEYPAASQGFFIYKYPAKGNEEDFRIENIVEERNEVLKENVPGMFENTYMTTSDVTMPSLEFIKYKGREFAQVRGYWEVHNDYMGGPFISHTFYSRDGKELIVMEGFVYAPRYDKRHYMREVESILYSFEWKDDSQK